LQESIDTATRWVYGWSRLVMGHKEAEVAEVKPSQNLQLHYICNVHSKTALKAIKNSTTISWINECCWIPNCL